MDNECKAPDETAKDVLADKDIPYEVRMKYIIDAYRKDQEKWGKLVEYAKHLETEVARLNKVIRVNGFFDPGAGSVPKSAQVIKELRAQIYELRGRLMKMNEYERGHVIYLPTANTVQMATYLEPEKGVDHPVRQKLGEAPDKDIKNAIAEYMKTI
jgi:hypothetical protein